MLDLTQIIKNQSDAATTTATAASDATSGNMVQAKGHQLKSLSMQTAVSADYAKTLSEMVAIYEEQTNNRIGKLEERQEIQKDFIDPLKGVGDQLTREIAALGELGKENDATKFHERAQTIVSEQQAIGKVLEEIASHKKDIDLRYMAHQVESIINWTGEIKTYIQSAAEEEVAPVNQPTTKP